MNPFIYIMLLIGILITLTLYAALVVGSRAEKRDVKHIPLTRTSLVKRNNLHFATETSDELTTISEEDENI